MPGKAAAKLKGLLYVVGRVGCGLKESAHQLRFGSRSAGPTLGWDKAEIELAPAEETEILKPPDRMLRGELMEGITDVNAVQLGVDSSPAGVNKKPFSSQDNTEDLGGADLYAG